jgi:lipopolysaccharide/colanic/teichoic acid biosynthesis glycosyltransferase
MNAPSLSTAGFGTPRRVGALVDDDHKVDWLAIDIPPTRWKRALDVSVGALALLLLSPIMLVAACLVRLTSPGPVLFHQTRIGRFERPYTMLKFRTMMPASSDDGADISQVARELRGEAAPDPVTNLYRPSRDPRLTPVGDFLRRFSVDELPQLFSVIRGDMSLVGPRPALPREVELFTPGQRRRHAVLPGLTGLWQIGGRNRLNSAEMLSLDLDYVDRCSLLLDLSILLRTPRAVLFHRFTR